MATPCPVRDGVDRKAGPSPPDVAERLSGTHQKIREAGSQPSVVSSTIIKAKPVIKPKVAGV